MNRLLLISVSAVVAMMALAGLIGRNQQAVQTELEAQASAAPRAEASAAPQFEPENTMVLRRDQGGQFHLAGEVNGTSTRFLVDTGADMVALTLDSAEAAGIAVDPASFQPIMRTASGTGNGAVITLDSLRLGETELRNVDAVVVQGLGVNLLGQNVLKQLGKVELNGDRMVIQPR